MSIESIALWHKRARPQLSDDALRVQIGCHLEEVVEMLDSLYIPDAYLSVVDALENLADKLKRGVIDVGILDRVDLLDSLADQIVTATGVGVCAGMDIVGGVDEVNLSNWSKFDEHGNPVFNQDGKIAKGRFYRKPELHKFTGGNHGEA